MIGPGHAAVLGDEFLAHIVATEHEQHEAVAHADIAGEK